MFRRCYHITEINLSNFDTSKVTTMFAMFWDSTSLTSIDLSNINTSQVKSMIRMFSNCQLLTSLNLSNFDTKQVTSMNNMFDGCANLEYINLNSFEENNLANAFNMFNNVPKNFIICISENIIEGQICSRIPNKECAVIDCTNDWKSKQKKLIDNNNNECIESCEISSQYKYEYNGRCYENCPYGYLYDENNNQMNKCKCELDKCSLCSELSLKNNLCTKCYNNYYPKENDPSNIDEYINCYNNSEGYYLDNNIFKKCYYTCKTCNISGNDKFHNCIECNDNYTFKIKNENYFNCYENCSHYYYFDDDSIYHCTTNISCPNEYPKLNEDTKECIKNNAIDIIKDSIVDETKEYFINNIEDIMKYLLINETLKMSKEEEIKYYDNLIQIIEQVFTSENYNTSKLDNGQDEYIKTGKMKLTLSTLENQRKQLNNNITTIDLGYCETLLKNAYNITHNETIYIKIIDIAQDGMKTIKVKYDIYGRLNRSNLIKLNLTACSKNKISIFIPFEITKNIDEYNSSGGYYNDICYTTTSEDGTDISIKDRRKKI